jgi:hypothetical protein
MDAVAIYPYQSNDPSVFSLNVGDELTVRLKPDTFKI